MDRWSSGMVMTSSILGHQMFVDFRHGGTLQKVFDLTLTTPSYSASLGATVTESRSFGLAADLLSGNCSRRQAGISTAKTVG
jgi:hypothetical protein